MISQDQKDKNVFPLISVILVSLNCRNTIERALQSIITLDYPGVEFIVVDGLSTDGTLDIIKKYNNNIDKIIIEKDYGVYDAMNKGVRAAGGDFIYFIGGDDVIVNSWRNLAGKMKPGNTVYYGNVYFPVRNKIYDGKFSKLKLLFRNISQQAIFYPASVFRKYSFSDKYPFLADYHLNLILKSDRDFSYRYLNLLTAVFSEKGMSTICTDHEFEKDRPQIIRQNYSFIYYLAFLAGQELNKWFGKKKHHSIKRL